MGAFGEGGELLVPRILGIIARYAQVFENVAHLNLDCVALDVFLHESGIKNATHEMRSLLRVKIGKVHFVIRHIRTRPDEGNGGASEHRSFKSGRD